ncbi:hypothetical protein L3X38_008342 [Prunus dulcis]|uniref:Uncharacterized protein n=1 Tax=Prunus dulcis TaxID=3755 RepID=A0AAD4ZW99_PRUDU|nr:hypothetical protein L3X38_008342 [Prunus dulcis]
MDMLDEFDDYMNAQRKSLATKAITATTTVKMDAAKDTATTTDVEMDAATATIKMDADTTTVEMDAATVAPKHKGSDSPAVVEIAIEKRKRCDSLVGVEINVATTTVEIDAATFAVKINASTVAVEINVVIVAAKNWVAIARLLATAKQQVVHNAKLYFGFAHPIVEIAGTNDSRLVAFVEKLAAGCWLLAVVQSWFLNL